MSADVTERAYNDPTLSPLDFLLAVMHDTHLPVSIRMDAAKAAAPYTVGVVHSSNTIAEDLNHNDNLRLQ
jgi:hypothetical protein